MSLLLANSDVLHAKQKRYLNLFDEEQVAGVLLASIPGEPTGLKSMRSRGRSAVLLNDATEAKDICSVVVNNVHAGYLAAKHLIELGRRRILFAGGGHTVAPLRDRQVGVERAIAEANGSVRLEIVATHDVQSADGRKIGNEILGRKLGGRPDAIVAAADLVGLGILQAFAGSEIRIPEDIAIVGHDNNRAAWDSIIPLTTISQPGHGVGASAAALLIEDIQQPARHVHKKVILEPSLIVRESTAGRSSWLDLDLSSRN